MINQYNDNRSGVVGNKYNIGDEVIYTKIINKKNQQDQYIYSGIILSFHDNFGSIYYEIERKSNKGKMIDMGTNKDVSNFFSEIDVVNEKDIDSIISKAIRNIPLGGKREENDIYIKLK